MYIDRDLLLLASQTFSFSETMTGTEAAANAVARRILHECKLTGSSPPVHLILGARAFRARLQEQAKQGSCLYRVWMTFVALFAPLVRFVKGPSPLDQLADRSTDSLEIFPEDVR